MPKYTIMNMKPLSRIALILLTLLAYVAAFAQTTGMPLREGVVIDKTRNTAYVLGADKKLKAVSLTTGEVQWTSPDSLKPLTMSNGRLLAQAVNARNELVISQLEVGQRARQLTRNSIALPGNVKADFRPSVSSAFKTYTRLINGETYILWEYHQAPLRGMPEPDDSTETVAQDLSQSGIIRVDRTSGRLSSTQKSSLPQGQLNKNIKVNRTEEGVNAAEQQFLSSDENHILTSKRIAGNEEFFNYVWEISNRASGAKVGELRDYRSFAPFYVTGTTIIYEIGPYSRVVNGALQEVPLHLVAVNLTNGRELWRTPIFDAVNRLSPPPRMQ
jgi:outer membrane protein assembly factor BamB